MKHLIIILGFAILIDGCAWLGMENDSGIPTIAAPPQRVAESNAAMPIIPNNKQNSSGAKTQAMQNNSKRNQPRIEEERSNGVVDQIKVNNKDLPSYYIYPTQQQNYNYNFIPDQNVSAPTWQISW